MNLIDNHRLHRPQPLTRIAGQQQIQRLRGSNQNLARMPLEPRPIPLRSIPRPHADLRPMHSHPRPFRHIRNPRQRRPQIPLHIHRQRLQRRNINHLATLKLFPLTLGPWPLALPRQHQPIQTPKKSRQRLPRPGRSQNQRRLPPRNRRPPLPLRSRHPLKHRPKPLRRHRMKQPKHIPTPNLRPQHLPPSLLLSHSTLSHLSLIPSIGCTPNANPIPCNPTLKGLP